MKAQHFLLVLEPFTIYYQRLCFYVKCMPCEDLFKSAETALCSVCTWPTCHVFTKANIKHKNSLKLGHTWTTTIAFLRYFCSSHLCIISEDHKENTDFPKTKKLNILNLKLQFVARLLHRIKSCTVGVICICISCIYWYLKGHR